MSGLVGVDKLKLPSWAAEERGPVGLGRTLRAFPAAMSVVLRLAWRADRRLTIASAVVHVLAGAATSLGLVATAGLLAGLLAEGPTPDRVVAALPAMLVMAGAFALRALLDNLATMTIGMLAPQIVRAAQDDLNQRLIEVQLSAFDDPSFRELVRQGIQYGIPCLERNVRLLGEVARSLVTMLAALVATALLSWWLVPVLLLTTLAETWSAARSARLDFANFLHNATRRLRLGVVQDLITDRAVAAELRAHQMQAAVLAEHRRVAHELSRSEIWLERRKTGLALIGRTLNGVGISVAYLLLGLLLYTGTMPLALAGAAVLAMRSATGALTLSMRALNGLQEQTQYVGFYQRCLREAHERRRRTSGPRVPADPAAITLDGVSFTYPGQAEPALHDITLTLRRGEVVALVGENGSGKTTLSKLIVGLYPPGSGTVRWDGVDLADADARTLHDQVALIAQEPARWPMTAENNVRVGRLDHEDTGDQRWHSALAASSADEVVASLPDGAATILSKQFLDGRDLSVGQWQRIGVARGVYRDAAVLIADEPTAALDARAEARVFDGLRRASSRTDGGSRTTVLVTHRLVNVRHADRIIVLHLGRVVEQGTHDELIRHGGHYAEMYALQADPYTSV